MTKGFKAYNHGLICIGKQYEIGKTFEEKKAKICECGMHYCDNPADLIMYHNIVTNDGEVMDITEVEDLAPESTDSSWDVCSKKYCTTKLKIGAKINFGDWVRTSVNFLFNKTNKETEDSDSWRPERIASPNYAEKLVAPGDNARLMASGDCAQLVALGFSSKLASSGNHTKLVASGDYAQIATSGDSAQLVALGDYARIAALGCSSQLMASGVDARVTASGEDSVIAAIGVRNIAKGVIGTWITLAEYKYDYNQFRYIPICVKTERVDGERIKANTWYLLEHGEFVEVKHY